MQNLLDQYRKFHLWWKIFQSRSMLARDFVQLLNFGPPFVWAWHPCCQEQLCWAEIYPNIYRLIYIYVQNITITTQPTWIKFIYASLDIFSDFNYTETDLKFSSLRLLLLICSFHPRLFPPPNWCSFEVAASPSQCSCRVSPCVLTLRFNSVQQSLAEMKGRQVWKALWSVTLKPNGSLGFHANFWSHLCHLQLQTEKKGLCK